MNSIMLTVMLSMLGGVAPLAPSTSVAAQQEHSQAQTKKQKQEQIYGSQLMTRKERAEHRAKMRTLKTREEREAYRLEHHEKMQVRAKEKGMTLPDEPPATGMGMGPGSGRNR